MIFAEKYLKHRFERGLEEGIEEGTKSERQRWVDWMARKQAAEDGAGVKLSMNPLLLKQRVQSQGTK